MPFPSGACQTCKTRRIKCDETKPACQRCIKSQRICLQTSHPTQASFLFHLENRYASGKTKRPRGPRSDLTALRPHIDLQTRALAYYLKYHVQASTEVLNVCGGLSEFVTEWNASKRTCPMVDLALASVALFVFAQTQQCPLAAAEASARYCRLLRMARDQIPRVGDPVSDQRNFDSCLLAVFLMGRYEGARHRPGDPRSNAWSHHDGAMAILKVWNDNPSRQTATAMVKQTRRGLMRSLLLRDLRLPDWMLDGDQFGEHGLELDYDRIIVRIINLRYASKDHPQRSSPLVVGIDTLNKEAQELDEALQSWATRLSITCSYHLRILTASDSWPSTHFYSSRVYIYSCLEIAAVWSQYFAARMLINSTRLRTLELTRLSFLNDFTYEQQRLECVTQLNAMADSLASTVPYCLERFKVDDSTSSIHQSPLLINTDERIKPYLASSVVWPLTVAVGLEGIDLRQQLWFKSELARMGEILGDGAVQFADTCSWAIV